MCCGFSLCSMKAFLSIALACISLLPVTSLLAQHEISFDMGGIRQKKYHQGGLNAGGFYHFKKQLQGGIEVNRFFPVHHLSESHDLVLSAWDLEMNFHYLLSVFRNGRIYPISGVSYTLETEAEVHQSSHKYFWSWNTGAGMLVRLGKFLPHAEYIFTWGQTNQQLLLIGMGYELEWGHHANDR